MKTPQRHRRRPLQSTVCPGSQRTPRRPGALVSTARGGTPLLLPLSCVTFGKSQNPKCKMGFVIGPAFLLCG